MTYIIFNVSFYGYVLAVPARYRKAILALMEGRNWLRLSESSLVAQLPGAFWIREN